MPTTPSGIWFPDDDDPARGQPDFQQLAESVDAAISNVTSDAGYVTGGFTGSVFLRKKLGRVLMTGGLSRDSTGATVGFLDAFYLPPAFRPSSTLTFGARPFYDSTVTYQISISPDGIGKVRMSGTAPGAPSAPQAMSLNDYDWDIA